MTGRANGSDEYKQLISKFLQQKLSLARDSHGESSCAYQAIANQYLKSPEEINYIKNEKRRHYEAEIKTQFNGAPLVGVERLYRRTILVEPTTVCFAHCRFCLRSQYSINTMKQEDLTRAALYMGSQAIAEDVNEVIITGGDPLTAVPLIKYFVTELDKYAKNIRTIRIHTRAPFHSPDSINSKSLEVLTDIKKRYVLEIGTQINHPSELWSESIAAIEKIKSLGILIYNQHPLLKGINDKFEILAELYDSLRNYQIEPHYMFHATPVYGMSHLRTTLQKGLQLIHQLSSCGLFSGRGKPKYAILSDIGKIVLYEGSIIEKSKRDNTLLINSGFNVHERKRWCPNWEIPSNVIVDENGQMKIWYLDGTD